MGSNKNYKMHVERMFERASSSPPRNKKGHGNSIRRVTMTFILKREIASRSPSCVELIGQWHRAASADFARRS